jgi:glucose/arabinose dehydrogenase
MGRQSRRRLGKTFLALALASALVAAALVAGPALDRRDRAQAAGITLPTGFQNQVVFSGLTLPTKVVFSPDGRIFVAEKSGKIKVFDSLTSTTPTLFADLSSEVYDYQDRGLLGLALPPSFPADPHVYVLYSMDAPIGGTPPKWNDTCPTPPGQTQDGCVTGSRLSRLTANGDQMVPGSEQVLIEDWCDQFPSHSIGTVAFGPDGALYAGGGDGASYNYADYGQSGGTPGSGIPRNPCGDPPAGVGGVETPPTAEGGALRAQSVISGGNITQLDGSIIRVDPNTGAALPDNPNAAATDPNARRIVAYGMRNPFRFTFRPGTTDDMWIGDVGWDTWEEIDHQPDAHATVKNFGWPCYEGVNPQPGYQALGLNLCQALYNAPGAVTPPVYQYQHGVTIVPGNPNDFCGTSGGSVSGLTFYNGGMFPGTVGNYPSTYNGALFFSDYSRRCITVMLAGADGQPDPTKVVPFASAVGPAGAVDLETGPGGDVYWVDIGGGTIDRIVYFPNNRPPTAVIHASQTSGSVPLTVNLDGTASTDPDGDPLTYAWDLGSGNFTDSTSPTPTVTFNDAAQHTVRLKVTDTSGASNIASVMISSGNHPPTATITSPSPSLNWKVGDPITFSATATDQEDGTLPSSAYSWTIVLEHCPDGVTCHEHQIQTVTGVKQATFIAPDHEYPAPLRFELTVTDSGGLTDSESVDVYPSTTTLTATTNISGATVAIDGTAGPGPLTKTVIVGSAHAVTAPLQQVGGTVYDFDNWDDGLAQSHNLTVSTPTVLNATLSTRSISVAGTQLLEGNSGTTNATVPVTLDHPASRPVTVQWTTQDGTATAPSDYTASSGSVVFPAGTTQQTINVPVVGDTTVEPDETFNVHLSSPENANLAVADATVKILDDDGTPILSSVQVNAPEGNSGITTQYVPVTLSHPSSQTVTVNYQLLAWGSTPNVDYTGSPGTLTYAPGETVKSVPINVIGDKLNEPDEAVIVWLSNPTNAVFGPGGSYGALLIQNDDPPPAVVGGAGATPKPASGNATVGIPVNLSAPSGQTVTVKWATTAYQAGPSDYVPANGTLTWKPGETRKDILVQINGGPPNASDLIFLIAFSSPTNSTLGGIGPGLAFGVITRS